MTKNLRLISSAVVLGVFLISKVWAFPGGGLGIPIYVWDARSLGMGGITTMREGPHGVGANPAMLSRARGSSLLLSGDYNYRKREWNDKSIGGGVDNDYLNFDALFFSHGHGKLGIGGGAYLWQEYEWEHTLHSVFGDPIRFETRGSIYCYSFAVGGEISPGFNVGIAANYQRGDAKDIAKQDDITEFSRGFRGYNYHFGSSITGDALNGRLVFSVVYKSPPKHTGTIQGSVDGVQIGEKKESEIFFPPTYQTGLAYERGEGGVALEYTYVQWSLLDEGNGAVIGDPFNSPYIEMTDVRTWRVGCEYKRVKAVPLRMGGYLTSHYKKSTRGSNVEEGLKTQDGKYLTMGIGLLFSELVDSASALSHCVLDIAAEHGVLGDSDINTFQTKFIKVMSSLRLSY